MDRVTNDSGNVTHLCFYLVYKLLFNYYGFIGRLSNSPIL